MAQDRMGAQRDDCQLHAAHLQADRVQKPLMAQTLEVVI